MASKRRSIFGLVLLVLAVSAASQWWAARMQANLGEQMAALARPGDIRMLSSRTCAICTVTRQWLQQHGVTHAECFIETDPHCAAQFEATLAPGTPVLLVRGRPQVGFDAQRVIDALGRSLPAS
jgi:glutaredoxin